MGNETIEVKTVHGLTDSFSANLSNFVLTRRVQNIGLADSIRLGLDALFINHDKAIVLEDDIIPTSAFFDTMDFYLETQQHNPVIGSITGANTTRFPPLDRRDFLISRRHSSWGWATWADRWLSIDWDTVENKFFKNEQLIRKVRKVSPDLVRYAKLQEERKIDSWATGMNIDFIKRDLLCVVPRINLISNIGFDGLGTHATNARFREVSNSVPDSEILGINLRVEIEESGLYNLLVRMDNSLLRDFPKGTVYRLIIRIRDMFLDSNRIAE